MASMNPLAEYLLALRNPQGGVLCRFGVVSISVPIFPAGLTVTWNATPSAGLYAHIEFYHRFSPQMVPGAFDINATHKGMVVQAGIMGELATDSPGYDLWVVIMDQAPAITTITNITAMDQLFESVYFYLVVDSPPALQLIEEAVRAYGGGPEISWGGR